MPRVECGEHGVKEVSMPWAGKGPRFTALFEALVIFGLREASLSAVRRIFALSWTAVDGIQRRAVRRGLERRPAQLLEHLGIDETSFQRRHEYATVVCDQGRGHVVHVTDGRTAEAV